MSGRTILICDDDEEGRGDQWKEELDSLGAPLAGWSVRLLLAADFEAELETLKARELEARGKGTAPIVKSKFDDVHVLVIDYDLALFKGSGGVTGENVAYLARCYSTCDVIVGVNLTGQDNPFDLTLVDHLDSFADVNVGADQLTSPGLWGGPRRGLHPWSWPILPRLVDTYRERVAAVGDGSPLLIDALGLRDIGLPRHALQLIEARETTDPHDGGRADEKPNPTFGSFALHSQLGLRGADRPWQDSVARIAAARAAKWLETAVLPGQDRLIDAPHLAQRNPLLLAGSHSDLEVWERTTNPLDPTGGLVEQLTAHGHTAPLWANRPLWRWPALSGDTRLPGVAAPWDRPQAPVVFCEDVSRFIAPEHTRDFVIDDVPTSLPTRYVANQADAAVAELVAGDLSAVQYGPKTRFAL